MCHRGQVSLCQEKVCFFVINLYLTTDKFISDYYKFVCNSRKLRIRRSIKVPAISNKVADIPADEFSWRKYGQKPIKGSPHPRYS
jgi:hypothetical protein